MTKLDQKSVKDTLSKLPLKLINILLVDCDKDCHFEPSDDAHSSRKALKNNREKLTNFIVKFDDHKTYNLAKDLADSLTPIDNNIEDLEEEIKPTKAQIKKLKAEKQALIDEKAKELEAALTPENSEKITHYNSVIEREITKANRQKQRTKALKEVSKGFIASEIDGVTEEFGEAICEVNMIANDFFKKLRTQIKNNKEQEINFDTKEGQNKVNKKLDREWKTHQTNILNKTRLNPDWKNNIEVIDNSNNLATAA
ncbi:MAG: hypothetical protein QNJ72_42210 [Pleurocapsa sp. MO_226.B13]|nr:hypothetical protein [Pleurocapsa sp. MO_226.B13]